jgi:chromosome segregation ATPase
MTAIEHSYNNALNLIADQNKIIEQLSKEVDHLRLDNDQYRIANGSLGERAEKLAKEIEELTGMNQRQSAGIARLEEENASLRRDKEELKQRLKWMTTTNSDAAMKQGT